MSVGDAEFGDVDADGDLDLVTSNGRILRGDGTGSFGDLEKFSPGYSPRAIGVGDLDGDGQPDFVVPDFDGKVGIVLHR
jgi:hypothetical protein